MGNRGRKSGSKAAGASLPEVDLDMRVRSNGMGFTAEIKNASGEVVGEIRTQSTERGFMTVNEVELRPAHRGQGYARAAYEKANAWAKSRGLVLRSDSGSNGKVTVGRMSADAVRLWDGFVRRGQATRTEYNDGLNFRYHML